jgi:DNA integrity scanning protein DisA with diadenylate cyclase activity
MATLSLAGSFLEPGAYDWGSISSGDGKLTEAVTIGRRGTEEDRVGNLIVYQKRRHYKNMSVIHLCRY